MATAEEPAKTTSLKEKTRGFYRKYITGSSLFIADAIFLILLIVFCMVFYNQQDSAITTIQANKLMECLLRGDFYDFYYEINYVWNHLGEPTPTQSIDDSYTLMPAIYPIITYLFYGIWNLVPMLFMRLVGNTAPNAIFFLTWAKVLEGIFAVICAHYMVKIYKKLRPEAKDQSALVFYFLTSTILLFGSFIFNQIDIFYTTFAVIALYYYYEKKYALAFLWFGISGAFKYFTIIAAVCILIFSQKKPLQVIKYALLIVAPSLLQTILFFGNLAGQQVSVIRDFGDRWFASVIGQGIGYISSFIALEIFALVIAFVKKPKNDTDPFPVWITVFSYAALLCFVNCNPQWFVILVPSLCLLVFLSSHRTASFVLEAFMGIGYLFSVLIFYPTHVSQNMYNYSLIQDWIRHTSVKPQNVAGVYFDSLGFTSEILRTITFTIFVVGLFGTLLVNLDMVRGAKAAEAETTAPSEFPRWQLYLRSFVILLFIVPSLMIVFGTYAVQPFTLDAAQYRIDIPTTIAITYFDTQNEYLYLWGYAYRNDQINIKNKYSVIFDDPNSDQDFVVNADIINNSNAQTTWQKRTGFYIAPSLKTMKSSVEYKVYIVVSSCGDDILIGTKYTVQGLGA